MKSTLTIMATGTILVAAGYTSAMSLSGDVNMVHSPVSVQDGDRTNNHKALLFTEQNNTALGGNLKVEAYLPGKYDGLAATAGRTLAAGRTVSSYMLHADVDSDGVTPVMMTGSISFNEKILGVIFGNFDASDALLGAPGTSYESTSGHGLDFNDPNGDMFRISKNRMRFDFSFTVSGITDQIRIITAGNTTPSDSSGNPIPEPVTTTLLAMGLGGLTLRRRHIEGSTKRLNVTRTAPT